MDDNARDTGRDKRDDKHPPHPDKANASLNSEIETAVENQGIVEPEDYPESERAAQTAVVTSKPPPAPE